MKNYIGIDIGSTSAKTIVMDGNGSIVHRLIRPTGWSSVDTSEAIRIELESLGIDVEESSVVATGYGRISVPYAGKSITEITCHGRGAAHIHGKKDITVIDVGGQDTKIIAVEGGGVRDFIMNDKCSAGTGRFLEVTAATLGVSPDKLCELASTGSGVSISSMCTVFAESEIISLIGRGEAKENIAYGIVDSIVRKVASQAIRLCGETDVCLTGGLCDFEYFKTSLGEKLGKSILSDPDGRYAGAVGAAISAMS